jgi:hypothetical protein
VQREDRADVLQPAGGDHTGSTGRDALLGRLEQQPHAAGKLVALVQVGHREADAQQDRGVHVVAAGVGDTVHRRAVGHVLRVLQRQGVEVGPQCDHSVAGADVADDPVARGQQPRREAGDGELAGDQRGRLELLVRELRVCVEVTSYGYQLGSPGGEPSVELTGQRVGPGRRIGPRRHRAAGRQRQRTRHVGFSITVGGWDSASLDLSR